MAKTVRKSANMVSARDRARAAKASLDAERAEHEKRIEDLATGFYAAADERDEALAVAQGRELEMAKAISELQQLGEPMERIATLCGIPAAEARRMRKLLAGEGSPVPQGAVSEGGSVPAEEAAA